MTISRSARSLMSTTRGQQDAVRVDAERVAVVDVVVDEGRREVVGGPDRVDVAGQVEVEVLHRDDLAVAAAGRAALDPEDGPERRLADRDGRALPDAVEALGEADRSSSSCPRRAASGVIAVTTTYLPRGLAASRRRMPSSVTFALVRPYSSTSSSWSPRSRAMSTIGRGVTDRAMSRSDGNGVTAVIGRLPTSCEGARAAARCAPGAWAGADEMGQEEGVGDRADAARHRRDRRGHGAGRLEVDVADELVADHVDPDVDDDRTRAQHLAGDQARDAGGHDHDLRVPGVAGEVAVLRVADRDRGVLAEQQERGRLADDVRAPDDHDPLARERDVRTLQDLDRGVGGRRQEPVVAEAEQAGVARVDAVDVLGRIERVDDGRERDPLGQRHLDDDPGDERVRG